MLAKSRSIYFCCVVLGSIFMQACEEQVQVCTHLRAGWILLVCLNIIADIVSCDVETSVYTSV